MQTAGVKDPRIETGKHIRSLASVTYDPVPTKKETGSMSGRGSEEKLRAGWQIRGKQDGGQKGKSK